MNGASTSRVIISRHTLNPKHRKGSTSPRQKPRAITCRQSSIILNQLNTNARPHPLTTHGHIANLNRIRTITSRHNILRPRLRRSRRNRDNHLNRPADHLTGIKTGTIIEATRQPASRPFLLLQPCLDWQNFRMGISLRQFEQMKNRVNGKSPRAVAPPVSRFAAQTKKQIILGIDPSLRGTGYGVIRIGKSQPVALAHGTISCPKDWERSRCLAKISQTLRDVLLEHSPDVCVVEGIFFAQNLKTAIIMGEARGAALAAVAESGIGNL